MAISNRDYEKKLYPKKYNKFTKSFFVKEIAN
jgi:hypothetical protein